MVMLCFGLVFCVLFSFLVGSISYSVSLDYVFPMYLNPFFLQFVVLYCIDQVPVFSRL